MRVWLCLAVLASLCLPAHPQNLLPLLSKWSIGGASGVPPDWNVAQTAWREQVEGKEALVVRGTGQESVYWRTDPLALKTGEAYVFRFRARSDGKGTLIAGIDTVNRDFSPQPQWMDYTFAFRVPEIRSPFARLGHWHLQGTAIFDRAELYPAQVVHRRWGELTLGEGEYLRDGEYQDTHFMGWYGSTLHRTLFRQRAYFNTNRWVFSPGDEVVYRHNLPFPMQLARLTLNVNYHTGGTLFAEVSRDGETWQRVLSATKVGQVEVSLPESLFPTRQVYVRLAVEGEGAFAQVDSYRFRAQVDYRGAPRTGSTLIVAEHATSHALQARWLPAEEGWRIRWSNGQPTPQQLGIALGIDGKWHSLGKVVLKPNGQAETVLRLPPLSAGKHFIALQATSGRTLLYSAQAEMNTMVLDESHYGYPLQAPADFGEVWWCEGAWKVGRDRLPPTGKPSPTILIEGARGEFEPAQLVLRAREPNTLLQSVTVSHLKGTKASIPAEQVRVYEVATVLIEHPSDSLGVPGEYPDPLPPLKPPLALPQERNQALWILVHIPEAIPAGDYTGSITVNTNRGTIVAPLKVRVFDFALPKSPSLRSGFGINAWNIKRYHHLETPEQERRVWEMYMRSFAEHRIAPYSFYAHAPIRVRFEGEGADKRAVVDFSEFDKAARDYLDQMGFNAFVLPIEGMGGGTFYERYPGEFGGFKAGTPEYERLWGDYVRQIEAHLREKGWLEKAYVYWFDEPEPRDYEFVIEGMQRLKRLAPGIRRMLTEQPEPPLYGHVDIWCGLTPEWTREKAEEWKRAGEEVWWYICTGPRAPYIGLFIEHPAVEMRLWGWQSWQYGIQGILIWETTYWTSPTAFPNTLQNPWQDPMSYVTGYGTPEGTKQFWGNGDGRFLYPPRRDPNGKHPPAVEPPSSSIRWENLRDGVEDYEYFVLLKMQIERLRGKVSANLIAEAEQLLEVPPTISRDLTNFTTDLRPLLDHRRKVARMIERLQKIENAR